MRLATVLFLLLAATAGAADFRTACDALEDGQSVRAGLRDGTIVEGAVAGWDGFRLAVLTDGRLTRHAAVDVQALWVRQRHTGTGAKVGGAIGAGGGAGFFTLMALILNSMDDDAVSVPGAAVVGGLLGAGAGAIVGAVAGSALPDWELVHGDWIEPISGGAVSHAAVGRRTGGLDLGVGVAWTENQDDPGRSFRAGLTTSALKRFELEMLFASHRLGPARRQYEYPEWIDDPAPEGVTSVWQAGAELRLPLARGRVRPYPAFGLAGYGWQDTFLGVSWGGGLAVDLTENLTGRLDWRRHDNVQNLTETDPSFQTLGLGVTAAW